MIVTVLGMTPVVPVTRDQSLAVPVDIISTPKKNKSYTLKNFTLHY